MTPAAVSARGYNKMRKILITLFIVIALAATVAILWVSTGRQISTYVDRLRTIEASSNPITLLIYEGNGTGGAVLVNDLRLNLDPVDSKTAAPHVGTTKENELALSFGGKVFPFGPVPPAPENGEEVLRVAPQSGDNASMTISHSVLDWIEPFNLNFMTGQSPSRKRHIYYELGWKRSSGATLKMLWRYEQHFLPGSGWGSGFMIREGESGLIRIEISDENH